MVPRPLPPPQPPQPHWGQTHGGRPRKPPAGVPRGPLAEQPPRPPLVERPAVARWSSLGPFSHLAPGQGLGARGRRSGRPAEPTVDPCRQPMQQAPDRPGRVPRPSGHGLPRPHERAWPGLQGWHLRPRQTRGRGPVGQWQQQHLMWQWHAPKTAETRAEPVRASR
jgi:hypothetical protein